MRARLLLIVALSLAVAASVLPPSGSSSPAMASERPSAVSPVFPGVERQEWRLATPQGEPIAAQVLGVDRHDSLRVAPVLARDVVPGLEPLNVMGQRALPRGGVAGVNGGFWLISPIGEPEGYTAIGGELVSEAESQGDIPRGVLGIRADGQGLVDRIQSVIELRDDVNEKVLQFTGVNRLHRTRNAQGGTHPFPDGPDAIYIYTPHFGPSVTLPGPEERGPATVLTFENLQLPAVGETDFVVIPAATETEGGTVDIPEGGLVVAGYGRGGRQLREHLGLGVRFAVAVATFQREDRVEEWIDIETALTGGPMIVADGRATDPGGWRAEGFSDGHLFGRAPRTAAGVTADGRILMVTVDGRQTGWSEGMTMPELAEFMVARGAVEAVSLDGGGSTQMVVDGITRNRPCNARDNCGGFRSVANGLFVFHDYTFEHTERLAGTGRENTAAAVAAAAFPDGASDVVLAAAGDFPDALAGGPLATALNAPLLLAQRDALAPVTHQAITTLGARRVTILGGAGVISEAVVEQLRGRGLEVVRVSGRNRLETAAHIARVMGDRHERVFIAAAGTFADALSAAAPAGMIGAPILLSAGDRLPEATRGAVERAQPREVVILGGGAAISGGIEQQLRAVAPNAVFSRLAGANRFGTAAAINRWAAEQIPDVDMSGLVVARGDTFPDALAGGPLAALRRHLLMIVPAPDIRTHPDAAAYLDERGEGPLSHVTLLGGNSVLSSHQQWQLDRLATP